MSAYSTDFVSIYFLYCSYILFPKFVYSYISEARSCLTPCKSRNLCPTSIQVAFQLHPAVEMCGPTPSMSHLTSIQTRDSHFTSIQVAFNLNTCPDICVSHPSRWCHISIQVLKIAFQLHPRPISNKFRPRNVHLNSIQGLCHAHLSSFQATFHLNICPDICISHPSRS